MTRAITEFVLGLGLLAAGLPGRAAGVESPAALSIDDLLTSPSIAPLSRFVVSPDGQTLAVQVKSNQQNLPSLDTDETRRAGIPWSGFGADIWLVEVATGQSRNLTAGVGWNWQPSWSPDGSQLAFISDRDSRPAHSGNGLWIWERATGRVHRVGQVQMSFHQSSGLLWTPDGRRVILRARPQGITADEFSLRITGLVETSHKPAGEPGVTAKVFEFDSSAPNAVPQTNQANPDVLTGDLAAVDVATGAVEYISSGHNYTYAALSPDGTKIAWQRVEGYSRPGTQETQNAIWVHDFATGKNRELIRGLAAFTFGSSRFSWAPRSDAVAYLTGGPRGSKDDLIVVPLDGPPRTVAAGSALPDPEGRNPFSFPLWNGAGDQLIVSRNGVLWKAAADGSGAAPLTRMAGKIFKLIEGGPGSIWSTPDGQSVLAFTMDDTTKQAGLAKINLVTGEVGFIFEEDCHLGGYTIPPQVFPDRSAVAYVSEDGAHAQEFWIAGFDARQPRRQLSRIAPAFDRVKFGRPAVIEWRGVDGNILRGGVLYPSDYVAGRRYPMIVKIYGGQAVSADVNRFGFSSAAIDNLQLYATRGYFVLYADSQLNLATPMADILKCVLPGVDRMVELGLADPNHIGVTGHSFGGYSTLALVVQTTRFKAAVARACIGNLTSAYGSLRPDGSNYLMSWAETGQARMGGTLWQYRGRYIENSPLFYLDRVTTPLLVIGGGSDIAPTQADEIFSGMRRLGKRIEYRRYAGEEHWEGGWSLPNQKDALRASVAWFDRYLKAAPSVAAPGESK